MEYINRSQMPAERLKRDQVKVNDEEAADQGQGHRDEGCEENDDAPFVSPDVQLIKSLYSLDENTLPCLYRLRPIRF